MTSQILILSSPGPAKVAYRSSLPVSMRLPSRLNETLATGGMFRSNDMTSVPVLAFQIFAPSLPPAMYLPSGLQFTQCTGDW